jgi:2-polyprenyl-6-methoxyphenol hydroxylase-like FAD-dependent oxidoreductase
MRARDPDVVVVGAGIAGASIAAVLAGRGLEVLLLERQRSYRDRVRGEFLQPWGVLEARAVGLEAVLRSTRAVEVRYFVRCDELVPPPAAETARAVSLTVDPAVQPLGLSHPEVCRALADHAAGLGVHLVRGAAELRIELGTRPSVSYRNGSEARVRPRLVIGADGRASTVRRQSGIRLQTSAATHMVAGLLAEGASRWPDDQYTIGVEGDLQFYVFPQGGGRVRLYTCHASEQAARWAGRAGSRRFLDAFAALRSIPARLGLADVTAAGPCATFGGEQTWCDEPCADGVVLLGDAGGYDDPVAGQGLSLAMADVGRLSGLLLATDDWTAAGLRPYSRPRAERLRRMRRVSTTYGALMTTFTPAGRARRARYYAASQAGGDDMRLALSAIRLGPDQLPADAFTDELHESVLA